MGPPQGSLSARALRCGSCPQDVQEAGQVPAVGICDTAVLSIRRRRSLPKTEELGRPLPNCSACGSSARRVDRLSEEGPEAIHRRSICPICPAGNCWQENQEGTVRRTPAATALDPV